MTNYEMVREFHRAFHVPCPSEPVDIPAQRLTLRRDLIWEEYSEFNKDAQAGHMGGIAKELADLLYVVYGTAAEYGIDMDRVFAAVHKSNMSKLDRDGNPIRREDGKILKGPDYMPADFEIDRIMAGG